MNRCKKESYALMLLTTVCCMIMALVETVIEPGYAVKSAIKVAVFLLIPLVILKIFHISVWDQTMKISLRRILPLLCLGVSIYLVIMGAFFLTKPLFDYASLITSLSADQKVNSKNFLWVALYISFGNSFLEEFLFRFVSFLQVSRHISRKIAYAFSSILFAVYHIAMIGTSFPGPLLILALIGLAVGGCIFNLVDEKIGGGSIYPAWVIHMCADFAIMTVWYLYI